MDWLYDRWSLATPPVLSTNDKQQRRKGSLPSSSSSVTSPPPSYAGLVASDCDSDDASASAAFASYSANRRHSDVTGHRSRRADAMEITHHRCSVTLEMDDSDEDKD